MISKDNSQQISLSLTFGWGIAVFKLVKTLIHDV